MPFDAPKIFLPGFIVLFALGIFASICSANAQSQGDQAKTAPAHKSPPVKKGLNSSVGNGGLPSLCFNGHSLLRPNQEGQLRPWKSAFRIALDVLFPLA